MVTRFRINLNLKNHVVLYVLYRTVVFRVYRTDLPNLMCECNTDGQNASILSTHVI